MNYSKKTADANPAYKIPYFLQKLPDGSYEYCGECFGDHLCETRKMIQRAAARQKRDLRSKNDWKSLRDGYKTVKRLKDIYPHTIAGEGSGGRP